MKLFSDVKAGFLSLRGSPSELFKAYILKFLESYAYYSFSIIFTLFLSEDFGYSDVEAGTYYGLYGALLTIYGLLTGWIIDNHGVANSVRWGFIISFASRLSMSICTSRAVLMFNICFLLPLGGCLCIPVISVGIRRYTNKTNRSFAFGLFYVILNFAAFLGGPAVDISTYFFQDNPVSETLSVLTGTTFTISPYRMVVFSGAISTGIGCILGCFVREIKVEEAGAFNEEELKEDERAAKITTFRPIKTSAWDSLKETLSHKSFWRFLVVILITLNVKMIFRHLDATMPKYMIREFGANVPYGTIIALNPAIVIFLVPIVSAATKSADALVMINLGCYISAASVFILVATTSVWGCVVFTIFLSIGEAIWSPRLYDYTMSMCVEGKEGMYMALSSAPLFLAKLPVGLLSGYLLQIYCPPTGPRNSQMMWFIIGALTATSPILMTVFWKYVSYRDDDIELSSSTVERAPIELTESPSSKRESLTIGLT